MLELEPPSMYSTDSSYVSVSYLEIKGEEGPTPMKIRGNDVYEVWEKPVNSCRCSIFDWAWRGGTAESAVSSKPSPINAWEGNTALISRAHGESSCVSERAVG